MHSEVYSDRSASHSLKKINYSRMTENNKLGAGPIKVPKLLQMNTASALSFFASAAQRRKTTSRKSSHKIQGDSVTSTPGSTGHYKPTHKRSSQ
ncbi:hypothetical protein K1719_012555 [Acacia pycnantha]|nr:hypothetical protein K1719_012555 [Acacia pycnantha]